MGVEIRPCTAEEMKDFTRIVSYVFASPDMQDDAATVQPDWTTCAFVDGKMAGTLGVFPFTVRFNGVPVPMGGVTTVGTLPQYRRRGLLRQMMQQAYLTCRERGQNIVILWASMGAIYQRFGYGMATNSVTYTFDPRQTPLQEAHDSPGTIDVLSAEDAMPLIKPLYIEYASPRNLLIHRAMPLWQASTLRPHKPGEPVFAGVYRNAEGAPRGYIVYRTWEERPPVPGGSQVMEVSDFVTLDLEAYRALWEFMGRHDLVWKVIMRNVVPEDDPAPELLLEPRMLQRSTADGIWMRVVDVEKALGQRPYGSRDTLRIAMEGDTMCPWNNGTFVLESHGMESSVVRKDEAPADLTVTPQGLAPLISGHRSATHLARAGRIRAASDEVLKRADALFRTEYAPHTPNSF